MKQSLDRTAGSWRNHRFYCGPYNEAIELRDSYRILYNSIEVATLSYCESYRWAEMYAAAPELVAACQAFLAYGFKGQTPDGRWVRDLVSAAVTKATGESSWLRALYQRSSDIRSRSLGSNRSFASRTNRVG